MPVQSVLLAAKCSSQEPAASEAAPSTSTSTRIKPSDIPAVANAFSGALGGAIANIIVSPVDLVTTRMQIQDKVPGGRRYKHVFDAFYQIYKEEGIGAFYSGATQSSLSVFISAFFYFYSYDILRTGRLKQAAKHTRSGRPPATLPIAEELLIGSLAGMFCKFLTAPLSTIVTRQQTAAVVKDSVDEKGSHHKAETSAIGILKEIYQEKGITGFWTGYTATMIMSVNPSLTYYFYQVLKAIFLPRKYRDNPSKLVLFLFPATAKTLATMMTYPLLLLKTHMQMKKDSPNSPSLFEGLKASAGQSGNKLAKLYLGISGQILKGFFSQGITMLTQDQISRLIIYLYFVVRKLAR